MTQIYKLTVEEICNKLRPVFGKKMDEIYLKYAMAETREEKEEIAQILFALYNKNLDKLLGDKIILEPPMPENVEGSYKIANITYAGKKLHDFCLREHDWPRHVCISGMSGSGKTTLGFHIIENFIEKKKPFIIFDWKKSFRPLILRDGNLMVYTVGNDAIANNFKFNVNEPPEGISPKEWINVLCDLITESFMVSYGVHKVILETIDEAFKEYGIYSGSKNYPTWNYIKWKLEAKAEKAKGRNATWLESALRVANVLTFGDFGKVCNYKGKESLKISDILNKKILFELNSLGNIEKKFFCEFILTYIYKLKKARENRKERFESAIVVDEAHNIFLKDKTHFVKESITDLVYREMREYGVSLVCLDQHISKISDTVKGNSACHIAFQQQLPADIYDISELMQLREKKDMFSKLEVGSAIVKLAERHTKPFLVNVEDSKLKKSIVSDEQIKQRMGFIKDGNEVLENPEEDFSKAVLSGKNIDNVETINKEASEISENVEEFKKINSKENKARVPNQALYNGEVEFKKQLDREKLEEKLIKTEIKSVENIDNINKTIKENMDNVETINKEASEISEKSVVKANKIEVQNVQVEDRETPKIEQKELTNVQEILYEFVQKAVEKGYSLNEIERIMERNRAKAGFSLEDIAKAINYFLKHRFDELYLGIPLFRSVTTGERKLYKSENTRVNSSIPIEKTEQEKFIIFLQANPNHELSTVDVYKKIGLSPRKGNKIKNELMNQGLIQIQEIKYNKGWKKLIRLNQN
ncbi:MAG: DUF87 domain-containing protein [Candidatus Pacearchaeota archaeon]